MLSPSPQLSLHWIVSCLLEATEKSMGMKAAVYSRNEAKTIKIQSISISRRINGGIGEGEGKDEARRGHHATVRMTTSKVIGKEERRDNIIVYRSKIMHFCKKKKRNFIY